MDGSMPPQQAEMEIIDLRPRPRYVMDFSMPAFHVPMPTQVCFYTGNVYQTRTKDTIQLVEISEVSAPEDAGNAHWARVTVKVRTLNVDDGHPRRTKFTVTVSRTQSGKHYGGQPSFVAAIDRWAKAPDARQGYADVLDVFQHGFGLINAKYLDLKTEMATLTATLARLMPSSSSSTDEKPPSDSSHVQQNSSSERSISTAIDGGGAVRDES